MNIKNITLEISAKPFADNNDTTMYSVIRKLFKQYERLTSTADRISILLWISDGSEVLEYSGNLDQAFEWARWIGIANIQETAAPDNEVKKQLREDCPPTLYRTDTPQRTYRWLKRLIEVIKEVGAEMNHGKEIRVGATFDNGPEFAISDFKYNRHREIAQAHSIYPNSFVTCDSVLNADSCRYAAFPDGIPEGIGLGAFLGAQYREFAKDLGYDYIWLSNGMGFGTETWGVLGMLFDKQRFYPERKEEATAKMMTFWEGFLAGNPEGVEIETRGSNHSAGVELSTDAAPLKWLYDNDIIAAPVNSPSSAICFNTGLSIAGWMSHIAELPSSGTMPFRYYIHDPWFANSPWLDRYAREPWDLFPVMSIGRIMESGKVQTANSLAFLTCDDSWGQMPDKVPDEITPLVLEAFDYSPDRSAPLLWVYPFEEYSQVTHPAQAFHEDVFIGDAINGGAPINTVVNTKIFRQLASSQPGFFNGIIPVIPSSCCLNEANLDAIKKLSEQRVQFIIYGSLNQVPEELCKLLGIENAAPVNGEVKIIIPTDFDKCAGNGVSETCHVLPQFLGGALTEVSTSAEILASAETEAGTRVIASRKDNFMYLRGLLPLAQDCMPPGCGMYDRRNILREGPEKVFPVERLFRLALSEFGWKFLHNCSEAGQQVPRLTCSRHDNAFRFCGYVPDTTVSTRMYSPLGAPIPTEREVQIDSEGMSVWHWERAPRVPCRVFVRQSSPGRVGAKDLFRGRESWRGRLGVEGLKNAEVRLFLPMDAYKFNVKVYTGFWNNDELDYDMEETHYGTCLRLNNISGDINVIWSDY